MLRGLGSSLGLGTGQTSTVLELQQALQHLEVSHYQIMSHYLEVSQISGLRYLGFLKMNLKVW